MNSELLTLLVETGMVQFGRFQHGSETRPFLLSLDLLPAYPDILDRIARSVKERLEGATVYRLVTTADSVPLGVAVGLTTGLSLVYSRGRGEEAAHDLVGAYNIGHAAVLLTHALEDMKPLAAFIASARRVGLDIHTLLAVVDLGTADVMAGLKVESMLTLTDIATELEAQHILPSGQAQTVLSWIEARRSILRPSAASP